MIRLALPEDAALDPKYQNRPHCGVTALAIVSGEQHSKVRGIVQRIAGYSSKWRGGMHTQLFVPALKELGVQFERTFNYKISISRFAKETAKPGATYLILSGSHAQVLQDGKVADQGGVKPLSEYRAKRCHAQIVFEIITPKVDLNAQVFGLPLFDRLT